MKIIDRLFLGITLLLVVCIASQTKHEVKQLQIQCGIEDMSND